MLMIMIINKIKNYYYKDKSFVLKMLIYSILFIAAYCYKYDLKGAYIGTSIILISMIIIPLILITLIKRIKHKIKLDSFMLLYLSILLVWGVISFYLYGLIFIRPFFYYFYFFFKLFYILILNTYFFIII